jgi:hypothetical protein
MLAALLFGCGGGSLPSDMPTSCGDTIRVLPDGTVCQVCNGVPHTRVYGGPDGWCDYDGLACECHGHGVGDQCEQVIADYSAACGGYLADAATKGAP